jgi:putative transposase
MTDKFQGKYRITSARLQTWDYGANGAYFITICTKDRRHYFGAIKNGVMQLSKAGEIAHLMWHEILNHAKNIKLGEFVVMPNHVHGVLILDDGKHDEIGIGIDDRIGFGFGFCIANGDDVGGDGDVDVNGKMGVDANMGVDGNSGIEGNMGVDGNMGIDGNVEGGHAHPLRSNNAKSEKPKTIGQQRFQNQGKNTISSIVGSYKSAVTKHCNRQGLEFAWQTSFHDHIIRDGQAFENIQNYIANNPKNWDKDKFHKND